MRLTAMRYKNFVWPHNPRTYTIEFWRDVRRRNVPYGGSHVQDLGKKGRIMRGEGEFVGPGAYDQFRKLGEAYLEDGPGILIHPLWMTTRALFTELKLLQEPRADYVRYSFTFWECYDGYRTQLGTVYGGADQEGEAAGGGQNVRGTWVTVRRGDTLWGIAARRGMALTELIGLNPQIKNPNLILVGEKVRVA